MPEVEGPSKLGWPSAYNSYDRRNNFDPFTREKYWSRFRKYRCPNGHKWLGGLFSRHDNYEYFVRASFIIDTANPAV